MLRSFIFFILVFIAVLAGNSQSSEIDVIPFRNPLLPVDERVDDLISRLTLEEKVLQLQNSAPAIPRLGIPQYNWWNECLHGVGRNGIATVFPQAIGMAATWNPDLIFREADVISTEARAKHHENARNGERGVYQGLTFWSPNINIFRDPRWGRGQETYGEDPFLTGRIGIAFVKGLQGTDPKYFKVISTAKHFAVHSGPESTRHQFDAWCSETDLYETYLPAFEALVREGKVYSVMCAYNRLQSQPCCTNDFLLDDLLRKKWRFKGYVVSDCGAIWDIYHGHKLQPDEVRSSVMGVKAGCDLTCGTEYASLIDGVKKGYISESVIDVSLKRLLKARFLLGMFDPENLVPYAKIPYSENNTDEHRKLAGKVARESIVLLKNDGILPLSADIQKMAVIGPYADKLNVLLGNYNGTPSAPVTFLQGIRDRAGNSMKVEYAQGVIPLEESTRYDTAGKKWVQTQDKKAVKAMMDEAYMLAKSCDAIIFCGGISPDLEGEELQVKIDGFSGGDRTSMNLPAAQEEMLGLLLSCGKPVILVLTGGSALSVSWENDTLPAILMAWYPGEEGGNALADVLFGDYNPAGRLPVTFYKSVMDLPPFDDYSMAGRTYKYFYGQPLYPFGYGLSYTKFDYISCIADKSGYAVSDTVWLTVTLKNSGKREGDEVIQVYATMPESDYDRPLKSLVGFARVNFRAGEVKNVRIPVPVTNLKVYDPVFQDYVIEAGKYTLNTGASSLDYRLQNTILVSDD